MKVSSVLIPVACACLLIACNQKPKNVSATALHSSSRATTVGEDVKVVEMEPDAEFEKAIASFTKGEMNDAAWHLREGAILMDKIAHHVKNHRAQRISAMAETLRSLANDVEMNQVKDLDVLNKNLGKAGRALSNYRLHVVEEEYFEASEPRTANDLDHTIAALRKSIESHHRKLTPGETQVLADASITADALQKNMSVDQEDIRTAIQRVDSLIVKWNKEFDTANRQKL